MYSPSPSIRTGYFNTRQGFIDVLTKVVFANGRPAARDVDQGRFLIRSVKDGLPLSVHTWKSAVREGSHLTQAMILQTQGDNLLEFTVADAQYKNSIIHGD